MAQTGQPAVPDKDVPPPPRFESAETLRDAESGLHVEERRYENRLDGVTVEHQKSGLRDYYDLNDPDIERRDGGIAENGAMRTWRLGVPKQ